MTMLYMLWLLVHVEGNGEALNNKTSLFMAAFFDFTKCNVCMYLLSSYNIISRLFLYNSFVTRVEK